MENGTITESAFNKIPTFFHAGKECMEMNGQIYTKAGVRNLLLAMGMLIVGM